MNKKINNLKDIQYFGNIELLSSMILKAIKQKNSDQLQQMSRAITEIAFYVNGLHMDRWGYNKSLEEYRADKNRAIERARRSEKKIEELEKQLKKFNIFNQK